MFQGVLPVNVRYAAPAQADGRSLFRVDDLFRAICRAGLSSIAP